MSVFLVVLKYTLCMHEIIYVKVLLLTLMNAFDAMKYKDDDYSESSQSKGSEIHNLLAYRKV